MPLPDDADEKWILKEHTRVKHEILRKYLVPWTRILSSANPIIHYFDGFAGRGYYEDGEPGSPILALEVADEHCHMFDSFICNFIEYNERNFYDLENAVDEKVKNISEKIRVRCINDSFTNVARDMLDEIDNIVPTFFFIDPFGYSGVDFDIISEILKMQESGVEVFLTFMVRDIRRFLEDEEKSASITKILGTEKWKGLRGSTANIDKETEILKIYREQLKNIGNVEYVWPFEMKSFEKRETVYFLIHATNHFKGFKVMKNVMFNAGAEDRMAFLGPDQFKYDESQQKLFETDGNIDTRVSTLKEHIFSELEGQRMKFWNVMKLTYSDTNLIEKHYREAIYDLEREHRAQIINYPDRPKGSKNGLQADDEVVFSTGNASIIDF